MKFEEILQKSCYANPGMVSSESDIDLMNSYILHNIDFISNFKYILTSHNKKDSLVPDELLNKYNYLWKDHFGDKVVNLNTPINRGHTFGTCDIENLIFEHTKKHRDKIEWVWKFASDIICSKSIFEVEVDVADFYYINNIGYKYIVDNQFDIDKCSDLIFEKKYFYPQTPYYIIRNCIDELNEVSILNSYYERYNKRNDFNLKPWEVIPFCDCESFLKSCVTINNLSTYHLLNRMEIKKLLEYVMNGQIGDGSLKNIMFSRLGCLCHLQNSEMEVFVI